MPMRMRVLRSARDADVGRDVDPLDRAREDEALSEAELEAEADVDAAQLQEAAAERRAGDARAGELGEELAAANEHVAGGRRRHDDFVQAVARANEDAVERRDLSQADAVVPRVRLPRAENGRAGHRGGLNRRHFTR